MKAVVDSDTCVACGLCPSVCPDVFSFGDDGKAHAVSGDVSAHSSEVKDAEAGCPVSAISTSD